MEYFRDPKNQIYADLALRLGKIADQYERLKTKEEKFESTLYISVLQTLMTNCNEYVREMTRSKRRNSVFNRNLLEPLWGVDEACWIKHTFPEKKTLQNFITRIRNSVSHPTSLDIESKFPSTGFTTIKDQSGIIKKFQFVNSPDTRNNRQKEFSLQEIENLLFGETEHGVRRVMSEFPDTVSYKASETDPHKYVLLNNGLPFIRISIIELTVRQLGEFVKNLSNYLAQPVQSDWDGITIKQLIAA